MAGAPISENFDDLIYNIKDMDYSVLASRISDTPHSTVVLLGMILINALLHS